MSLMFPAMAGLASAQIGSEAGRTMTEKERAEFARKFCLAMA